MMQGQQNVKLCDMTLSFVLNITIIMWKRVDYC